MPKKKVRPECIWCGRRTRRSDVFCDKCIIGLNQVRIKQILSQLAIDSFKGKICDGGRC